MLKLTLALALFGVVFSTILGGFEEVDTQDENVQSVAKFLAKEISTGIRSKYHRNLVKVTTAFRQVVDGYNYKLNIEVGSSTCLKSVIDYDNQEYCGFQEQIPHLQCFGVVYEPIDKNGARKLDHYKCLASGTH